jgi:predicted phosphatase
MPSNLPVLIPDVQITRRLRTHNLEDQQGENLATFQRFGDVLHWLHSRGHNMVLVETEEMRYVLALAENTDL